MNNLSQMKCVPCRGNVPYLSDTEIAEYQQLVPDWKLVSNEGINHLERVFPLKNFAEALGFTNKVAELAETEDHHPAILTEWGKVTVRWWTHKIKGVHRNDFIMAAKTGAAYKNMFP